MAEIDAAPKAQVHDIESILSNVIRLAARRILVRHEPISHHFRVASGYCYVPSVEIGVERSLQRQREVPYVHINLACDRTLVARHGISPGVQPSLRATRNICVNPEDSIVAGGQVRRRGYVRGTG